MDVYVSKGVNVDPNEFQNDLEFRRQSSVTISSTAFPTMNKFVVAVRVNGIDFITNTYQKSRLFTTFTRTSGPASIQANLYEYLEMPNEKINHHMNQH